MNSFSGVLKKMWTKDTSPVSYYLELGEDFISMNQLLNLQIKIEFTNHFECGNCKKDLPIYSQGYCKSCFFIVPNTNASIFKPELSTAHLGIEQKNLEWEQKLELQPHVVYLAFTGDLKVGVTRKTQIPTRWIDQGAISTTIIAETSNRYEAGLIEVALSNHMANKTNYRKMLITNNHNINLLLKKQELKSFLPKDLTHFFVTDSLVYNFNYPLLSSLEKVETVLLKNTNFIVDTLIGIKGQYLIFKSNKVFNIRNHEGYCINLLIQK